MGHIEENIVLILFIAGLLSGEGCHDQLFDS